ncbi:MAG TPA: hypothetical protein VHH32_12385 [Gemmatimonadales bacterium]|nr:hypothetical protein [Gemmatimonadales bacterium]
MRRIALACLIVLVACDDDEGPSGTNYAGNYPGEFYVIASSTEPEERDSIPGGDATLSLTHSGDDRYHFSETTGLGGPDLDIEIDAAGTVGFPTFAAPASLDLIESLLGPICDLANATAIPSGSVVNGRLTITVLATGATCDWSAGLGNDVRPTEIQLTWTGTRS